MSDVFNDREVSEPDCRVNDNFISRGASQEHKSLREYRI